MFGRLVETAASASALRNCTGDLQGHGRAALVGAPEPLIAAYAAALQQQLDRPLLVVARGPESAEHLLLDLQTFAGEGVALFSAHAWARDEMLPNVSVNLERMETLNGLLDGHVRIVVAPCAAVVQEVPTPAQFSAQTLTLAKGTEFDLIDVMRQLYEHGYERADMVEFRGEFSSRGGILDIFPVTSELPLRLEFFGDELTSIRTFEIHSQRSTVEQELARAVIPPAREATVKALSPELPDTAITANVLEYFPRPPLVIWHEFRRIMDEIQRWDADAPVPGSAGTKTARLHEFIARCSDLPALFAQEIPVDVPDSAAHHVHSVTVEPFALTPTHLAEDDGSVKPYQYTVRAFAEQINAWQQRGFDTTVICATDADRSRVVDLLTEEMDVPEHHFQAVAAQLSGGWILPDVRQAVVTDDEVFKRVYTRRKRLRRARPGRTTPIDNIATINIGEYVVHINHGIGQFEGIRAVKLDSGPREMIIVRYRDDALLYVPLEQAHLIERYINVGGGAPELDTLGSGRWMARRTRTERAVLDLAADLLERQAQRETLEGYAFQPDSEWQVAFEKAFPYAETPDQATSIHEVKDDMEKPRPMDRLICGDVGFGKTEVALRAAFKAVLDGKQVAVLVPTTILAQQHWHTFGERVADYPVRVEVLSRFVPARQQKDILRDLREGHVDIVIGTHRLLSKEVTFKALGLIIVDEEQRFGVRSKEKLKQLRALVDVLTLSATPIPRTLYQALTGARDMSTILTPPEERVPVKTLLIKRDYRIIREAILRELNRGGQVFFLHNRVQTIDRTCEILQQLVPTARFGVGHGQMHERELSQMMEDFNAGRYDVLVCTMIVESGLDMPNVNTIVIDNAHMFGLADLYQLRGRVGRSGRQAYAYLIVPPDLVIDGAARHRLKAILEHTALGSGYAIAMKDLEIRGAGNILGPQQSGHVAAVGFNLYCKLLQRAVALLTQGNMLSLVMERKAEAEAQAQAQAETGQQPVKKADWRKELPAWQPGSEDVHLDLPFTGNIPEEYIESAALRLDIFRRLGLARTPKDLQALENELRDRFGPVPDEAALLLRCAEVRIYARQRGIDHIEVPDGKLVFRRQGAIINPLNTFPRITGMPPLPAVDAILAHLSRLEPLAQTYA